MFSPLCHVCKSLLSAKLGLNMPEKLQMVQNLFVNNIFWGDQCTRFISLEANVQQGVNSSHSKSSHCLRSTIEEVGQRRKCSWNIFSPVSMLNFSLASKHNFYTHAYRNLNADVKNYTHVDICIHM